MSCIFCVTDPSKEEEEEGEYDGEDSTESSESDEDSETEEEEGDKEPGMEVHTYVTAGITNVGNRHLRTCTCINMGYVSKWYTYKSNNGTCEMMYMYIYTCIVDYPCMYMYMYVYKYSIYMYMSCTFCVQMLLTLCWFHWNHRQCQRLVELSYGLVRLGYVGFWGREERERERWRERRRR